jgi:hypothetical protein
MRRLFLPMLLATATLLAAARPGAAIEVRITAPALERTLRTQLFNDPNGRYYLRGDAKSPCYTYADDPHITFKDDRIVVHVHTRSRLGTSLRGSCLGIGLSTNSEVSFIPDAENETIGFRNARIEHITDNREINFLLVPFLSGQLPAQMKVNAADILRKILTQSNAATGYNVTLNFLKIHSMIVEGDTLVLDVDATMHVD